MLYIGISIIWFSPCTCSILINCIIHSLSRRRTRNSPEERLNNNTTTNYSQTPQRQRNEGTSLNTTSSTLTPRSNDGINFNNVTGSIIKRSLIPQRINKEHLSTEAHVRRTLENLTIDRINQLTASWILVNLFREAMNYAIDEYGACTWAKPDNWNAYVQHFRTRFNDSNETYPWGQNGYIESQHQDHLYSLEGCCFNFSLRYIYIQLKTGVNIRSKTIQVAFNWEFFHEAYN